MEAARAPLWRSHLVRLVAVIAALLAIFARDAAGMVSIWWNSSTYTHCLFVVPLAGWLVWLRRAEVRVLVPSACPPALLLVFAASLVWMVGEAAGVALFRHAGLVFMIQASVLALLGRQVTAGLLFPLFYLVFAIPFGDELVPMLQTITARLCMVFLGWAGIPAHIEGVFITIPTGAFEVAEACSGVKFLVAMLAYATLVANMCFRSWTRRIAFLAVALVAPILANGARAYATIHISYLSGNSRFAANFDHIVFGWIFFALVLLIVMALGWRFFDRGVNDPWLAEGLPKSGRGAGVSAWPMIASVLLAALLPVAWLSGVATLGRSEPGPAIALPDVRNWERVPVVQAYPWRPRFDGADQVQFVQYADAKGNRVDLVIARYDWQAEGREMIGYGQGAFDPRSNWSWANDTATPSHGRAIRIFAPGVEREVLSFYRIGGMTTGNASLVKLETLKARLLGQDQSAVAILVSAEDRSGRPARPAIDAFLRELGPAGALAGRAAMAAKGR